MPPADRWDHALAQDGRARITASRRWLFLALAAAVVLFPLGLQLWTADHSNRAVAGLLLAVSVFGAVVSGWRIARPERLDVTPDGIRYRRIDLPWSDVAAVRERTTSGNRFVLLRLTDDAADRLGSHTRLARRPDDDGVDRPCLEVPGPFDHPEELVAWLEDVRLRRPDDGARRGSRPGPA